MGAKETLGYSTRTDAVLALRRKGLTTREIAGAIGIEPKTVTALEASADRRGAPREPSWSAVSAGIFISHRARVTLRRPAAERGVSVDRLVMMLIEAIADDELVDAILDDKEH